MLCNGWRAIGTATSPQVSATYTSAGTLTCAEARLGIITTAISCTYTLTGSSLTAGVTTGTAALNCVDSTAGCRITGTIPGRYTNATTTTGGQISLNGSSGLASSGCILSGAVSLSPNPIVFTVTNGTGGKPPDQQVRADPEQDALSAVAGLCIVARPAHRRPPAGGLRPDDAVVEAMRPALSRLERALTVVKGVALSTVAVSISMCQR